MARLTFTNEKGQKFEISDLTLDEVTKLAGLNGHANKNGSSSSPLLRATYSTTRVLKDKTPDYDGLKRKLTAKAKQFLSILAQNPNGVSADHLVSSLQFTTGVQLGGMVGGGLARTAANYNVDISGIYSRQLVFNRGERQVIYKPGKEINRLL